MWTVGHKMDGELGDFITSISVHHTLGDWQGTWGALPRLPALSPQARVDAGLCL